MFLFSVLLLLLSSCRSLTRTRFLHRVFVPASFVLALDPAVGLENSQKYSLELQLATLARTRSYYSVALRDLDDADYAKAAYIDLRLSSKALLTTKIPNGSSSPMLFKLASFRFRSMLATSNASTATQRRLIESISSIVEWDGLDSLSSDSPRTTLFERNYSIEKVRYVRQLGESIVQLLDSAVVEVGGENALEKSSSLMLQYYPDEIFLPTRREKWEEEQKDIQKKKAVSQKVVKRQYRSFEYNESDQ